MSASWAARRAMSSSGDRAGGGAPPGWWRRMRGPSRFPLGLWVLGGFLILVSLVLPWYSYSHNGASDSLSGVQMLGSLPELGALAVLGLALILLAFGLGERRVWRSQAGHGTQAQVAMALVSLVAFILPVEAVFRFDSGARTLGGVSFLDGIGVGWGLALIGGTLALLGTFRFIFPAAPLAELSEDEPEAA
jgi:hypothetical protein